MNINFDELLTDIQPPPLSVHYWIDRQGLPQYGIFDDACMSEEEIEQGECGWYYASVSINDADGAYENDIDDTGTIQQEDYALRLAKTMAAGPELLRIVKEQENKLFQLTNKMDEGQQNDIDALKQRAVHPSLADFIQALAEWGLNYYDNIYVWEAICSVIEAGERGEFADIIASYEEVNV